MPVNDSLKQKIFTSKIPKPLYRQLSKTPVEKKDRKTNVRRRSFTTAKKTKQKRKSLDREDMIDIQGALHSLDGEPDFLSREFTDDNVSLAFFLKTLHEVWKSFVI